MTRPRFDAVVTFVHPDEGGRQTALEPPFIDYLPVIRIHGDLTHLSVRVIGGPAIDLGGSGRLSFIPVSADTDYSALRIGARFNLCEGDHAVGHGIVMHVLPLGWPRAFDTRYTGRGTE